MPRAEVISSNKAVPASRPRGTSSPYCSFFRNLPPVFIYTSMNTHTPSVSAMPAYTGQVESSSPPSRKPPPKQPPRAYIHFDKNLSTAFSSYLSLSSVVLTHFQPLPPGEIPPRCDSHSQHDGAENE